MSTAGGPAPDRPLLVPGVGNPLSGHDGVGIAVVAALRTDPAVLPPDTELVDGGTGGLALLPLIHGARGTARRGRPRR